MIQIIEALICHKTIRIILFGVGIKLFILGS